jgi:hypothetical protein
MKVLIGPVPREVMITEDRSLKITKVKYLHHHPREVAGHMGGQMVD